MDDNLDIKLPVSYNFKCPKNYYGRNCKTMCIAKNNKDGHYTCNEDGKKECLSEWTGEYCDKVSCHNCESGECHLSDKCKCILGFSGARCNQCDLDDFCKHGTCGLVKKNLSNSKTYYKNTPSQYEEVPHTCDCKVGWSGYQCDKELRYCNTHQNVCQNGGKCYEHTSIYNLNYICQCSAGYSGKNCEIKTGDCFSNSLPSHDNITSEMVSCKCYSGYTGPSCQLNSTIHRQLHGAHQTQDVCISEYDGSKCLCKNIGGQRNCHCSYYTCSQPHTYCVKPRNDVTLVCRDRNSSLITKPLLISQSTFHYINISSVKHITTTIHPSTISLSTFSLLSSSTTSTPSSPSSSPSSQPSTHVSSHSTSTRSSATNHQDYFYYYLSLTLVPLIICIITLLILSVKCCFKQRYRPHKIRRQTPSNCTSIKTIHNNLNNNNCNANNNPFLITPPYNLPSQHNNCHFDYKSNNDHSSIIPLKTSEKNLLPVKSNLLLQFEPKLCDQLVNNKDTINSTECSDTSKISTNLPYITSSQHSQSSSLTSSSSSSSAVSATNKNPNLLISHYKHLKDNNKSHL